jgi:hypothetical protein
MCHREGVLAELKYVAVKDVARRDPSGPISACDEDASGQLLNYRLDERFGSLGARQRLIVVEN